MILINGIRFYDEPASCGSCAFFNNGSTQQSSGSERGHCITFDEMHHRWATCPRRCQRLFKKAFTYAEGTELMITANLKSNKDE